MKIANDKFGLPNLSTGKISSDEIQSVISSLKERCKENTFVHIIADELTTFARKIDVKKGLVQEELDPLSPKLLIEKSFDKINNLFLTNRDFYFHLIQSQYEMAINSNKDVHKNSSKS